MSIDIQVMAITLTPYMVLPLFAIRFTAYAGGIRVSFIHPPMTLKVKVNCPYFRYQLQVSHDARAADFHFRPEDLF